MKLGNHRYSRSREVLMSPGSSHYFHHQQQQQYNSNTISNHHPINEKIPNHQSSETQKILSASVTSIVDNLKNSSLTEKPSLESNQKHLKNSISISYEDSSQSKHKSGAEDDDLVPIPNIRFTILDDLDELSQDINTAVSGSDLDQEKVQQEAKKRQEQIEKERKKIEERQKNYKPKQSGSGKILKNNNTLGSQKKLAGIGNVSSPDNTKNLQYQHYVGASLMNISSIGSGKKQMPLSPLSPMNSKKIPLDKRKDTPQVSIQERNTKQAYSHNLKIHKDQYHPSENHFSTLTRPRMYIVQKIIDLSQQPDPKYLKDIENISQLSNTYWNFSSCGGYQGSLNGGFSSKNSYPLTPHNRQDPDKEKKQHNLFSKAIETDRINKGKKFSKLKR